MIGASFLFLKERFPLVYQDCHRMEKNLVEGDGVESIMLSGRILERITKIIFEIESFDYVESQFKRIQKLDNVHILTKDIKNDFNQIRILRNDVYHRDVSGVLNNNSSYLRTYSKSKPNSESKSNATTKTYSNNKNYYSTSSSTKTYKYNETKANNFRSELSSARKAHKIIFNICIWFYEEYGGDKSFTRPFYKIGKRPRDIDIMIRLKSALENENDFKQILVSDNSDNNIIKILKELKGLDNNHKESSKDLNLVFKDNKKIKIRKPNKPYSECIGISYDDDLFMWKADYDGKELGLFNTSKEAYESRQVFLNSIPIPKLNSKGKYSNHEGISFSKINKMWTVRAKGQIISYHGSEKSAIKMRDSYYKKHNISIKYGNKRSNNSSSSVNLSKSDFNNTTSISKGNKTNKKSKLSNKSNQSNNSNKNSSTKKSNKSKLDYGSKYKKSVKVKAGKRVAKTSKKAKKTVQLKRKASKYEGVYYEESLFMWSAEVDGKELGLFPSEEEAKSKRDEYIKNNS